MQEVRREAERLKLILPTAEVIKVLEQDLKDTNAILHVTCQWRAAAGVVASFLGDTSFLGG